VGPRQSIRPKLQKPNKTGGSYRFLRRAVFSADDVTTIRGSLFNVPRDNVIFEAGLFSGYLGSDRCFMVVPQETRIQLPSDLSGITVGQYEDNRADGNNSSAVSTFSDIVRQRIQRDGLFQGPPHQELRDLIIRFECCSWITDEPKRVERKRIVCSEIEGFCKAHPLNKHRLFVQHHSGYNIALLNAIRFHPEPRDWELIKQIRHDKLPPGFAYYKLMDAVEALKASQNITAQQLQELQVWLKTLPGRNPEISARVDTLLS
jgi:Predicted nucleotide-binding protein containing TIR-like domain